MTTLGNDFADAFRYAATVHDRQVRKGTNIPYITHLMSAAALVLEAGGDEDLAIAALLHDAAEDQGGQERLDDIRFRFGDRVAAIVDACSDTYDDPKPPWRERKGQHIEHLRAADADALLVSCADKLHNARSILSNYRTQGEKLWERFDPESDRARGQLWYYDGLVEVFQARLDNDLSAELGRTVDQLRNEVESNGIVLRG